MKKSKLIILFTVVIYSMIGLIGCGKVDNKETNTTVEKTVVNEEISINKDDITIAPIKASTEKIGDNSYMATSFTNNSKYTLCGIQAGYLVDGEEQSFTYTENLAPGEKSLMVGAIAPKSGDLTGLELQSLRIQVLNDDGTITSLVYSDEEGVFFIE